MTITITVDKDGTGYHRTFQPSEARTIIEWLTQYAEIGEIEWIRDLSDD